LPSASANPPRKYSNTCPSNIALRAFVIAKGNVANQVDQFTQTVGSRFCRAYTLGKTPFSEGFSFSYGIHSTSTNLPISVVLLWIIENSNALPVVQRNRSSLCIRPLSSGSASQFFFAFSRAYNSSKASETYFSEYQFQHHMFIIGGIDVFSQFVGRLPKRCLELCREAVFLTVLLVCSRFSLLFIYFPFLKVQQIPIKTQK
jgi:hypothetical protein